MGFLQNQNLTQPEVTHWESTPHLSAAVNNTIIVLGVLTFALQLCLVLLFMLRCWTFDNRVREALKDPETVKKLIAPSSFHQDTNKQTSYQPWDKIAASSTASSAAGPFTNSLFAPSIPWDLVQS
ncbi:uncharacterized protein LOC144461738 [Epinephelus lanceolatus]